MIIEDITPMQSSFGEVGEQAVCAVAEAFHLLREIICETGIEFTVVPGACAFVSALVLGGLDSSRFCFHC